MRDPVIVPPSRAGLVYDIHDLSYPCDHLVLEGHAVVGEYERRNYFPNRSTEVVS